MDSQDDNSLCARMDAKMAEILSVSAATPGWSASWKRLHSGSTWQERLKVYQMIRDSGSLPMEAGFYLVCRHVDAFVDEYAGEALKGLDDRIAAIMRRHRLGEDDFWGPGEGPAEYE